MEEEIRKELLNNLKKLGTNTNEPIVPVDWKIPDLHNCSQPIVHTDLDAINANPEAYKDEILEKMKKDQVDPATFVGVSIFEKAPDINQLGKVDLDKPQGENFAALEEENAAMNQLRLEVLKKKKKQKPDEKALLLLQRKRKRRLYRLMFRKVFWRIVLPKAQRSTILFFEKGVQQCIDIQNRFIEKRREKQQRPKIKWQFMSFNKRHNLRPEDIARKFAQRVKA